MQHSVMLSKAIEQELHRKQNGERMGHSIYDKMLQYYLADYADAIKNGRSVKQGKILEKVVLDENLQTLIVNLYAGNEGYSLMLRDKEDIEVETVRFSYDESEFLDYIDSLEIPPLLVDLLEQAKVDLFYNGCIIAEVRDYRKSTSKVLCETHYLLLKPTSQTIIRDVNVLTSDSSVWTDDDRNKLEAELVLAAQPTLCLDPNPEVLLIANRAQYDAKKLNHRLLKRSMKRIARLQHSSAKRNRTQTAMMPSSLKLFDFINKHRDKRSLQSFHHKLNRTSQSVDMWKQRNAQLSIPGKVEVLPHTKMHDQPKYVTDSTPEKIQEIVLEGEKTNNRSYFCRVTILRRPSTGEYLGELYLEEDRISKEEPKKDGRACRFSLGSRPTAQRYLQQFQELYTEEGRKSVKISTFVANQGQQQQQQQQHSQQQSSHSNTMVSSAAGVTITKQGTVQMTSSNTSQQSGITLNSAKGSTQLTPGNVLTQGNTYILTNAVGVQHHNLNTVSGSIALNSNSANTLTSTATSFTISGSGGPYFVAASNAQGNNSRVAGTPGKILSARTIRNTGNENGTSSASVQLSAAYIQSVSNVTSSQNLAAVPIAVQGNSVSIVPANMNSQFLSSGNVKGAHQAIRPAGATSITMLQNASGVQPHSVQVGQPRLQAQFAVPGSLVPISTRMGANGSAQKGQQIQPTHGMASVMLQGKQVMVQGQPMIQGQAFIPSQTPLLPGQTAVLPGGQTAVIQGGSFLVQGQPGQTSLVTGQAQGQAFMIQQNQNGQTTMVPAPSQGGKGQGTLVQGQTLQGQTVFIQNQAQLGGSSAQGQTSVLPSQTIMVQNQGQQSQMSLINTSLSQSTGGQSLHIVTQVPQQQGSDSTGQTVTVGASGPTSSTALSALTSQVNLIPVQTSQTQGSSTQFSPQVVQFSAHSQTPPKGGARRKSAGGIAGGKRRSSTSSSK